MLPPVQTLEQGRGTKNGFIHLPTGSALTLGRAEAGHKPIPVQTAQERAGTLLKQSNESSWLLPALATTASAAGCHRNCMAEYLSVWC